VFRKERQNPVTAQNSIGNGTSPLISKLDFVLIKPNIMSAFFEVGFNHADELFIVVVAVTEEDAEFVEFLFRKTEATIHAGIAFSGIKVFDVCGAAVGAMGWLVHEIFS
jgi:hypothetical protein